MSAATSRAGRLSVFCWCGAAIRWVEPAVIARCETESCGRPNCRPGAPTEFAPESETDGRSERGGRKRYRDPRQFQRTRPIEHGTEYGARVCADGPDGKPCIVCRPGLYAAPPPIEHGTTERQAARCRAENGRTCDACREACAARQRARRRRS